MLDFLGLGWIGAIAITIVGVIGALVVAFTGGRASGKSEARTEAQVKQLEANAKAHEARTAARDTVDTATDDERDAMLRRMREGGRPSPPVSTRP